MKMKRNPGNIVLVIIVLIYNLIIFGISTEKSSVYWCAYIFSMLAFLMQFIIFCFISYRSSNYKNTFFGISLTKITKLYLLIQIITGIVFMIIPNVEFLTAFFIQIIIFDLYLICLGNRKI